MLLKRLGMAAGVVVLTLTPALALTYRQAQGYQNYLPTPTGQAYDHSPYAWSPDNICVKDCDNDMNPCDPGYFKRADGRCGFSQ